MVFFSLSLSCRLGSFQINIVQSSKQAEVIIIKLKFDFLKRKLSEENLQLDRDEIGRMRTAVLIPNVRGS